MNNEQKINAMIEYLQADRVDGGCIYFAHETRTNYRVTDDELIDLYRSIEEHGKGQGYSLWCADGAGVAS